jgi:hypothetical protein
LEAGIAAEAVCAGLTSLRKATYAAHGLYLYAFLSLSVGIERILKLIVVLDHAIENAGLFPTKTELKSYGHDIGELFKTAEAIAQRRGVAIGDSQLPDRVIGQAIIAFLTKFATDTRYYNLNVLSQNNATLPVSDPMAEWFTTVGIPLLDAKYSEKQRLLDEHRAKSLGRIMDPFTMVRRTAEDGTPILSMEAELRHGPRVAIVQKEGTFHCAVLVKYLTNVLWNLNHQAFSTPAVSVPHLYEFFALFLNEHSYLRSRKTFPTH